jgi:hypothetical protein
MLVTGTFLEMSINTDEETQMPVILCPSSEKYFVCLPEHDGAFFLNYDESVDKDTFTLYMDGSSAEVVAAAVIQALKLFKSCGGEPNGCKKTNGHKCLCSQESFNRQTNG